MADTAESIQLAAARYALNTDLYKITSALDLYARDMLREHYSTNGIPPRGSVRWREAERIMHTAYVEFYTYYEIRSDYEDRWRHARS